ncbi:MAG: BrnT family toxin [Firmicutes bacterium]|nr:BrnT family toxin [Bacillota bacterium]
MSNLQFEWDPDKSEDNRIKHGVTFEDAETVFDDVYAVLLHDEEHSEYEERFILIGVDSNLRRLYVCHCYRGKNDEIVRIISARKATKAEQKLYRRK